MPYQVTSRVVNASPVITATANPLVALYSAPPCPIGSSMYVTFGAGPTAVDTNTKACTGITSMNFYVAGMAESTQHVMRYVLVTGSKTKQGPPMNFTTGAIPANLSFPAFTVPDPVTKTTETKQPVLLMDHISSVGEAQNGAYFPTAYNLSGSIIWYYSGLSDTTQNGAFFIRPVDGGTFLLHANDPNSAWIENQLWREIDLAGNTIRQTNATRVNEQINAAGYVGCTSFSHDSIRLPNGHTMIICTQEQIYPTGTQGATGPVDIEGGAIVDLDENLQLAWYWSGYDHLNINRPASLGETVQQNLGFTPLVLATVANDWLHCNSLNYIPSNGDVLLSTRNQDWVLRVNYANGAGDGSVVWKLGLEGSFTIVKNDPYPWFTHQHDVEYELGGTEFVTVYDNGNLRVAQNPGKVEHSRGAYISIDETSMLVTPLSLIDLGKFSVAGGSAQLLDNGNQHYHSSLFGTQRGPQSDSAEYVPDPTDLQGTLSFDGQAADQDYRSYRMVSLYQLD